MKVGQKPFFVFHDRRFDALFEPEPFVISLEFRRELHRDHLVARHNRHGLNNK